MEQYKVIDGAIYAAIDTQVIKQKITDVYAKVMPFIEGIAEIDKSIAACQTQRARYTEQIRQTVESAQINPEIAKLVDPEKASAMGFQ